MDWDHDSLVRANKFLPGTIAEEHERAKLDFLKMSPNARIEFMRSWEAAIEADGRPTKGVAALWRALRDFEALHFNLLRVSR
jgi:hypothetical protein